ncbi:MAG: hypothetical protein NC187_06590 [Candidatus Amulumruptor caecigallinarius]|nr:hypothetical protein [Candidatus Amulumruptor caecigallinarius]MCM1397136.1 hypothetical protein [Candidatus Amulumruptor caecigallinarius]MCM1453946.1 hypothetical protein [bacterium]
MMSDNSHRDIAPGHIVKPPAPRACKIIVALVLMLAFALSVRRLLPLLFAGFISVDEGYNPYVYDWGVTDFLINFEGGFVRRGVVGQLLYELCRSLSIPPLRIIYPLCLTAYIAVLLAFVLLFRRRGFCFWIPLIMFLCGYWKGFVHKDFILFGIMLFTLWVASRPLTPWGFAGLCALCVLTLLMHEAYIFWGVPVTTLVIAGRPNQLSRLHPGQLPIQHTRQQVKWAAVIYPTLAVATCALLSFAKGTPDTALSIAQSWHSLFPDLIPAEPTATVESVGWTLREAVRHHLQLNFCGNFDLHFFSLPKWMLQLLIFIGASYVALNMLLFFRLGSTNFTERHRVATFGCYLGLIICMLPMFIILSNDYERLWQYLFMALFGTVLTVGAGRLAQLLPDWWLTVTAGIVRGIDRVLPPNPWVTGALMTLLTALPWQDKLVALMYQSPLLSLLLNRFTLAFFGGEAP